MALNTSRSAARRTMRLRASPESTGYRLPEVPVRKARYSMLFDCLHPLCTFHAFGSANPSIS
jgi:hypothetical protein